jgi:hypothetical protein
LSKYPFGGRESGEIGESGWEGWESKKGLKVGKYGSWEEGLRYFEKYDRSLSLILKEKIG